MKALALLAVILAARPAAACRCAPLAIGPAMKEAKHAFVGRVVAETRRVENPDECKRQPDWCSFAYTYKIAVEGSWKGDITKDVEIDTGGGKGDCSMGKLRSARYVFFATGTAASPAVHLCGGTRPATKAVLAQMTSAFGAPAAP